MITGNFILVGLSHKTAPVEVRERLAFSKTSMPVALAELGRQCDMKESLIISTCNRVEVLAHSDRPESGIGGLKQFLAAFHGLGSSLIEPYLYAFHGDEAVRHVFRVASSLDSMVVGEPQILAQLKEAFQLAAAEGAVSRHLNSLLPRAFFVAKRVRTETRIANSAVSVSTVAVDLARKIFGDLHGKSFLMLGAGKMGQLAARSLIDAGISDVFVANRSNERTHELCKRYGGVFVPFDNLAPSLASTDIVLVCTASRSFLLDHVGLSPIIRRRKYRPLFVIDISVPRNVDPRVNELDNVFLYDIDDLQSVVESNLDERRKEAEIAEQIVSEEVNKFARVLSLNSSGPMIGRLRRRIEEICLEELKRSGNGMDPVHYAETEKVLLRAAHRLAHPFIVKLKRADSGSLEEDPNLEWIKEVLDLDDGS